jgi:uncharacterized alpha/beta hydrolase family protein
MKKEEKLKKIQKESSNRKNIIIVLVIFALIVILTLFGAQIYLWINLFLGNDIIIRLNADKENLFLVNAQKEELTFQSSILTNPFCSALCDFSFTDLSQGEIIDSNHFSIKPSLPVSKKYVLNAPSAKTGQNLYRFDIHCKSQKTFLCHTKETIESRSVLVTLNYDLDENNKKFKQESMEKMVYLIEKTNTLILNLQAINETINKLNENIETRNLSNDLNEIENLVIFFNQSLESLKDYWREADYSVLLEKILEKENSSLEITGKFQLINNTFSANLQDYNFLIENLNQINLQLKSFQKLNLTNYTSIELTKVIKEFNYIIQLFSKKDTILNKKNQVNNLINQTDYISKLIKEDAEQNLSLNYLSNETILIPNLTKIHLIYSNLSLNLSFEEPISTCCFFKKCRECCNDSCSFDKEKFPVLFIHGHDFSRDVSAEMNLNIFDKIQRNLEKEGYVNAGSILLSSSKKEEKGLLGKPVYPITLKASYYFDIFKTKETTTVLQTKKDNIDTYAIRLRDIINEIKYKTNRKKIVIVAYSMGGLVSRRYLQIFGEDYVDKLILIATPNKGITDTSLNYCSVFGAELECKDMDKDSLFLNKLNNGEKPNIPIFNIIGLGCDTDGEPGDGIVKNSSAYFEGAENYFVKGTCKGVDVFHTEILFPDKYPEVYELINKTLKNNS